MVSLDVHAVPNPFKEGFEYLIDMALFSVLLFLLAEEGKLLILFFQVGFMPCLQLFQLIQFGIDLFIRPFRVGLRGLCHHAPCLRYSFRAQRRYRLHVLFRQHSGIRTVAAVKLRSGKKLFHAQTTVKTSVHKAQPEPFIHQRC